MNPLPLGLLGVSHVHAAAYAQRLSQVEWARLVGFVEPEDGRAEAFARQFGVPRCADAAELRRRGAKGLVVAGDNAQRLPSLREALAEGLPALAEKPFGLSLTEAGAVVDAFAGAGLPLGTAFPMRFAPSVEALVEAVHEGRLGTLRALVGENVGRYPGDWFGDPTRAGGGALPDHSPHLADLFAWLTGMEPHSATALPGAFLETGVERTVGLFLDYPDGLYASLDASWARPEAYPVWGGLSVVAVGDRGTAEVHPFAERLTAWTRPPALLAYGDDLDGAMLRDFVQAVEEGRPPRASGRDGLKALRIQVAAQRSLAEGRTVSLSET